MKVRVMICQEIDIKGKITGKPMYQLAPHVKLANSDELEGDDLQEIDVK